MIGERGEFNNRKRHHDFVYGRIISAFFDY